MGYERPDGDVAQRTLGARALADNQLEALKGRRSGQCSIRVNDQFRVCFRWTEAGPTDVEIVDTY